MRQLGLFSLSKLAGDVNAICSCVIGQRG